MVLLFQYHLTTTTVNISRNEFHMCCEKLEETKCGFYINNHKNSIPQFLVFSSATSFHYNLNIQNIVEILNIQTEFCEMICILLNSIIFNKKKRRIGVMATCYVLIATKNSWEYQTSNMWRMKLDFDQKAERIVVHLKYPIHFIFSLTWSQSK